MTTFTNQQARCTTRARLPYGSQDLDPLAPHLENEPNVVRCYVRDCDQRLQTPGRNRRGDVCPHHHIRCHRSSAGNTYSYQSARKNIIASPDVFADRVVRNPFKYETHRFGNERSEDALSWNVFRSLLEASCLGNFGEWITGIRTSIEPKLYLWGMQVSDDEFDPWHLLVAARERFESSLPVERPKTEPDIAIHLPGRYLILIEAKFTSPNTCYLPGPRKDKSSLTFDELLGIYQDPSLRILNLTSATAARRIHYQLWRNTIFAEWMARYDHPATLAYHVNLVRGGYEQDAAREFSQLLMDGFEGRFQQITWEQIYHRVATEPRLDLLRRYMETKTAGLLPAFRLSRRAE